MNIVYRNLGAELFVPHDDKTIYGIEIKKPKGNVIDLTVKLQPPLSGDETVLYLARLETFPAYIPLLIEPPEGYSIVIDAKSMLILSKRKLTDGQKALRRLWHRCLKYYDRKELGYLRDVALIAAELEPDEDD